MDLQEGLEKFIRWATGELAEDTINAYKNYIVKFIDWIGKRQLQNIDLFADVIGFREYLQEQGHKEGTINIAMIALRRYFQILEESDCEIQFSWSSIPIKNNIYKDSYNPLDEQDYRDMVNEAIIRGGFVGRRDEAMMRLLWSTGLRVSELTDLDVEDVHLDDQSVTTVTRKRRDGINRRTVPFTKYCRKALEDYLAFFEASDGDPLWISTRGPKAGQRLSVRTVQRRVTHYAKEAGLDHTDISPHSFRHAIGERAADSFFDERYLGRLMGHATPGGTDVYFNVKNPKLQKHYHDTIGDNSESTAEKVWTQITETLAKANIM